VVLAQRRGAASRLRRPAATVVRAVQFDQPALHALLQQLQAAGLELYELRRIER
jgi:hypothetical protein